MLASGLRILLSSAGCFSCSLVSLFSFLLLSLTPEPGWFDEPPPLPPLPPPLRAANYYFRDPEATPLSEDPPKPAPPSKASKVQNQNRLERAPPRPIATCHFLLVLSIHCQASSAPASPSSASPGPGAPAPQLVLQSLRQRRGCMLL